MAKGKRSRALVPMVLIGLMAAGPKAVESVFNGFFSITARHFTANVAIISVMIALHRLSGCVVQPYVAWKSDRHRGRRGRRRPYLIATLAGSLVSLALVGAMPGLIPAPLRGLPLALGAFFLVSAIMQIFWSGSLACADTIYGDRFDRDDLGRASGIRTVIYNLVGFGMAYAAIPLGDRNEFLPYLAALLVLAGSLAITVIFLREEVPADLPPREIYQPLRPLDELREPYYLKVSALAAATAVVTALTVMLHPLFVVETLHLSKRDLGHTTAVEFAVGLATIYLAGHAVDKLGPKKILASGYLLVAVAAFGLALRVSGLRSLYFYSILLAIGNIAINIPIIPLIFRDAPAERRGSVYAAVQMVRAAAAAIATVIVGLLAHRYDSLRICYFASGLVGLGGAVVAVLIRRAPRPVLAVSGSDR